jgi:hypothetical protein
MTDITRRGVAFRASDWLSLTAAPTFALMAVATGVPDSGAHQMSCSSATHIAPLAGMAPMYALMSAFHLAPWLRVISRWTADGEGLRVRESISARSGCSLWGRLFKNGPN